VFSVGSVPRDYKRAQKGVQRITEEYKEYNGVQRSTRTRMERVLVICEVGRLATAL
jgi:hypothetical protein